MSLVTSALDDWNDLLAKYPRHPGTPDNPEGGSASVPDGWPASTCVYCNQSIFALPKRPNAWFGAESRNAKCGTATTSPYHQAAPPFVATRQPVIPQDGLEEEERDAVMSDNELLRLPRAIRAKVMRHNLAVKARADAEIAAARASAQQWEDKARHVNEEIAALSDDYDNMMVARDLAIDERNEVWDKFYEAEAEVIRLRQELNERVGAAIIDDKKPTRRVLACTRPKHPEAPHTHWRPSGKTPADPDLITWGSIGYTSVESVSLPGVWGKGSHIGREVEADVYPR